MNVNFQLDSGASISTLSLADANRVHAKIVPSSRQLQAYNGGKISVVGETSLNVTYNNNSFVHNFRVISENSINLLGRDLFQKLGIQIKLPDSFNNVADENEVLHEFKDYLSDSYRSNVKTTVHLDVSPAAKPVFCKARQVPVKLRDKVICELHRLAQEGKLTKIYDSKWASPIVTVFKNDGSLRICGDFSSTVNKFLDPVQTPLPTVDDTISRIGHAQVFSKIDLSHAFLQLNLDESSKQYTVINTVDGLYQYNNLCFGLTASPSIFQSFITKTLSNIKNLIIYQDDVLVLTPDHKSHVETLRKVLNALKDAGIKINSSKSKFFVESVTYLGHVFDKYGVKPNPSKTKSILDAPAPKNVKETQSFVGLCTYYARFVPNFAHVMSPLYHLLKKDVTFHCGPEQQNSFDSMKKLFVSDVILQHYDPTAEFMLETDSSSYGLGSVLFQRKDANSPWLPVQFASRTLNSAERNYSNIEREALSVIFGLEKFKHYLLGVPFIIKNDQKPLLKLFANDKSIPTACSSRIQLLGSQIESI